MSIDAATVRHVANLARIHVDEDKEEKLAEELSNILAFVEQLSEVDTDGVEPMTSVAEMALPMREDVVNDGNDSSRVLSNAPKRVDDFYVVPKVVE
ncbi:MAG: Asp-tRNA(Asn)/Glu-tRNA(Gln) amidotransferase subunit GatC [Alphaproteobacteria bacterium]